MRVLSKTRGLARALLTRSPVLLKSARVGSCRSLQPAVSSGSLYGNRQQVEPNYWFVMQRQFCSSVSNAVETSPSESSVKDLHDKIMKSVGELKTAPPNSLVWSLIQQSATREDIELLFSVLQRLRVFRLSNLRIHDNFNVALCEEVAKACVRAGAIDYAKKTLWEHNLYGLTPTIGSAHKLLLYAEQHKDIKLVKDVMDLLKKNKLPLQAGTADIVFRICYQTENWGYLCKYGKRFITNGVNLRQTSFETWMEFAAEKGDLANLWKVEKLRSDTKKPHTLKTGFACAKGLLLENVPESAASVIKVLNDTYPDGKRQDIVGQLQKLVSEWPLQVIKHQKEENQKDVASVLQKSIPSMIVGLYGLGDQVNVDLDDLTTKAGILS